MRSAGERGRLAVALAALLFGSAPGCSLAPVSGSQGDSRIKYRLVTKADFWKIRSNYWHGDITHGAEISTNIERSDSYLDDFSFEAVMYRDRSYWNRVIGPVGMLMRIAAPILGIPIAVPEKYPDWYILQHEQVHFAITEVNARLLTRKAQELAQVHAEPDFAIEGLYRKARADVVTFHRKFDGDSPSYYSPDFLETWVRWLESQMQGLCGTGPYCRVRQVR